MIVREKLMVKCEDKIAGGLGPIWNMNFLELEFVSTNKRKLTFFTIHIVFRSISCCKINFLIKKDNESSLFFLTQQELIKTYLSLQPSFTNLHSNLLLITTLSYLNPHLISRQFLNFQLNSDKSFHRLEFGSLLIVRQIAYSIIVNDACANGFSINPEKYWFPFSMTNCHLRWNELNRDDVCMCL